MIAGTPYYGRIDRLRSLVQSVDSRRHPVHELFIADNSPNGLSSQPAFNADNVAITRLYLESGAGVAAARNALVDACPAESILLVDSDVTIPPTVGQLEGVLEADETLGAVGGMLLEDGQVRSECYDLVDVTGILARDCGSPTIERVGDVPVARFDMIQNVMLCRAACLEDYRWDEEFIVGSEHLDFFRGHRDTDWEFAVTPSVVFPHDPGGPARYRRHRYDIERLRAQKRRFLDKWGYRQVVNGRMDWLAAAGRGQRSRLERVGKRVVSSLPWRAQAMVADLRDGYRAVSGEVPT